MSENRYRECVDLIKLYKKDIIQKALKRVIANKMREAIKKANVDEELILDEFQPIKVKYEIEIDKEFVAMAYDVFEQIIELLEKIGSEDDEKKEDIIQKALKNATMSNNPYKLEQ